MTKALTDFIANAKKLTITLPQIARRVRQGAFIAALGAASTIGGQAHALELNMTDSTAGQLGAMAQLTGKSAEHVMSQAGLDHADMQLVVISETDLRDILDEAHQTNPKSSLDRYLSQFKSFPTELLQYDDYRMFYQSAVSGSPAFAVPITLQNEKQNMAGIVVLSDQLNEKAFTAQMTGLPEELIEHTPLNKNQFLMALAVHETGHLPQNYGMNAFDDDNMEKELLWREIGADRKIPDTAQAIEQIGQILDQDSIAWWRSMRAALPFTMPTSLLNHATWEEHDHHGTETITGFSADDAAQAIDRSNNQVDLIENARIDVFAAYADEVGAGMADFSPMENQLRISALLDVWPSAKNPEIAPHLAQMRQAAIDITATGTPQDELDIVTRHVSQLAGGPQLIKAAIGIAHYRQSGMDQKSKITSLARAMRNARNSADAPQTGLINAALSAIEGIAPNAAGVTPGKDKARMLLTSAANNLGKAPSAQTAHSRKTVFKGKRMN